MLKFEILDTRAVPLFEDSIDTDQLCPKQHLKAIRRVGFGAALFSDRRWRRDGSLDPGFVLNDPRYAGAGILIGGHNFGSGSSREHAVWALVDYGIRCVIAPGYGDIFFQNSVNSGLLAIRLPVAKVAELAALAERAPDGWRIDLPRQRIEPPASDAVSFDIEAGRKQRLLEGLDEIALTMQYINELTAYQQRQRREEPWLWDAA